MKLFKSTILALLGLAAAAGFTACSEDNYVEASKTPGAYFASTLPTKVNIPVDGSSFDVKIQRVSAEGGDTYELGSTDPSGLFSIPTSVTFPTDSLWTNVTIGYDPAAVELSKAYPIELSIKGASAYGNAVYKFNAVRALPMQTKMFAPRGKSTGIYTYVNLWQREQTDMRIAMQYNPQAPNKDVNFVIGYGQTKDEEGWGYNIELNVSCPEWNGDSDVSYVFVKPQFTGYTHSTYGEVWVADIASYWGDYRQNAANYEKTKQGSGYIPSTGTFKLNLIYFIPNYGTGGSYLGDTGYETFQMDGFPHYEVNVEYEGFFTTPKNKYEACGRITVGADVAKVGSLMIPGKADADIEAAIASIEAEDEGVVMSDAAEVISTRYPLTEGGEYTIVAVSFDGEGKAQESNYTTFKIELGGSKWKDLGNATFVDGWIYPIYDYAAPEYTVPVQQSTEDANVYRLVGPFAGEYHGGEANNVEFRLVGGGCIMEPQESGFANKNDGAVTVMNVEGYFRSLPSYAAKSDAEIVAMVKGNKNFADMYTVVTEGVIKFQTPLVTFANVSGGPYNATDVDPGYIYMPGASKVAKKKAVAKMVAKPNIQGLSKTNGKHDPLRFMLPTPYDKL